MKIDPQTWPYLTDEKISNAFSLRIGKSVHPQHLYKIPTLEDLVRGRDIIHLGCADHLDLIDAKIKKNIWIHQRLTNAAASCLGIDIDSQAIEHIKAHHSYKNILCADIIKDHIREISDKTWDYMVLGELLEHIDNPQEFLLTLREKYHRHIKKLIVTVPNAFYVRNFVFALQGREVINSNHRSWFSPYTLCKNLILAGLKVEELMLCQGSPISRKYFAAEWFLKTFPLFRGTIIAIASL